MVIKFKWVNNPFQRQLASDANMINTPVSLFVPADKTINLYKVDSCTYDKLLQDNIITSYEKTDSNTAKKINSEAKAIAKKLKLENRIETLTKKKAFITFKDHKPNFINNLKCRLINPAKSNIGKVSKKLLDAINSEIQRKFGLLKWRNSSAVILWFRNFSNKNKCKFLVFDIVDFYPSISKKLLTDAINFGKQYSTIDSNTSDIIFTAESLFSLERIVPG